MMPYLPNKSLCEHSIIIKLGTAIPYNCLAVLQDKHLVDFLWGNTYQMTHCCMPHKRLNNFGRVAT